MIGQTLGSCEIIDKLGQGGMGEVWRARDTRLGREVALKLLPTEFADDPERMARFDREARTLASLHHPNIASLFGFEESGGVHYLVMELVEGEELADRIDRGPIDPAEVEDIARQIALGLEAAHEKGITHRDLKPSNVRITPTGEAKILDFGLARATGPEDISGDPALSPTITAAMTQQGVILGTAAYMSPEQARGKPVDARADNWAFGVIVWEMLCGRRLFEGETMSDTLASVLRHEIALDQLPAGTPPALRRILDRCLQRDPRQRLHSIADARIEMEDPSSSPQAVTATGSPNRLPWVLVALLAVVAGGLALRGDSGSPEVEPASYSILVPEESPIMLGDWPTFDVSPDGRQIAVTTTMNGRAKILLRDLDSREYRELTDGSDAISPFFSPDGEWIGFFQSGQIRKVSVRGGSPVDIAPMSHPRGMFWGDDGFVYFVPSYATGIHRALAHGGGDVEIVTTLDTTTTERTHRWPDRLPGRRGLIFTSEQADSPGDYEDADIKAWDAETGEVRSLGIAGAMARYSPTGHLLVARQGTIYAYPFDVRSLEVTGDPKPVQDRIAADTASGRYSFRLASNGDFYFLLAREGDAQRTLAWVDREGNSERIPLPPGPYRYPNLDPTDTQVALVLGEAHGGNDDVYLLDLETTSLTRVTFDRNSIMPKWHPSGRSIYYTSMAQDGDVFAYPVDGSRPAERAVGPANFQLPGSISSDGSRIFFTRVGGRKLGAITTSLIDPESTPEVAIDTWAAEWAPKISPDGRWLAYVSDESGREEIYVQPWPLTGAKWQISHDGGRAPLWSPDGRELFFCQYDRLLGVRVMTDSGFRATTPELIFTHQMDNSGVPMSNYDISSDGQRFLVVEPDQSRISTAVHVETGWTRNLSGPNR